MGFRLVPNLMTWNDLELRNRPNDCCSWLYQCVRRVVTLVMTADTMSFRYELACKGHSTEKAQDLVT